MRKTLDLTPTAGEMLKPKELLELHGTGSLTLQDRRVYNELVQHAWGPALGRPGHWFEIPTAKLREAAERNTRLVVSLHRLQTTLCTVVDDSGNALKSTQLLSSIEIETGTNSGTLRYKFTEELAVLLEDSTIFAKLDLAVMKSFSSKYAYSLYEAISRRIRLRQFTEDLTIEELRELLGVEEGKLATYKNLHKRAIEPALLEVNAITPYDVSIVPVKAGRKVTGFKIGWSQKAEQDMKEAYREMQRPKVGRKARIEGRGEEIIDPELPATSREDG